MATVKLRDVLLPKPFVGVALWTLAGIAATALFFAGETSRVERGHPTQSAFDTTSNSTGSTVRTEDSPQATATAPTSAQTLPTELDAAPTADSPTFVPWGDNDPELTYRQDWPDRTHEVVVWKHESMTSQPETYHLGTQGDPRIPGATVEVTAEVFGPDNDLRIFVMKSNGLFQLAVELKTARRHKRFLARVWSEDDTWPNPPPEWIDVGGEGHVNTWIWPEVKPLVIDYSLTGVQEGMRHFVHDRVVIDF